MDISVIYEHINIMAAKTNDRQYFTETHTHASIHNTL